MPVGKHLLLNLPFAMQAVKLESPEFTNFRDIVPNLVDLSPVQENLNLPNGHVGKIRLDYLDLWRFAINLRNDLVHFDGYARQSMSSPITDHPITMKLGDQSEGVLRSFLSITTAVEDRFASLLLPSSLYRDSHRLDGREKLANPRKKAEPNIPA